ncbi:poly(A)-binding protein binding protein [Coemansia interrupta]|uniref:Poly(A)-binding protein binding protein n=1 Tax=Coemansia interrupta TaxID=1126814 RepID=A0A9W8LDP4_9FUNG|nr:poly(A)-binding protein binding protein [Coemansia interrupta]
MNSLTRSFALARSPVQVIQRGLKKKSKIPVTLLKDIPRVGSAGAVIQVNKAYMRHELFPKRLAAYVEVRGGPLDRTKAAADEAAKAAASPLSKDGVDMQQRVHSLALTNQDIISRIAKLEPLVFERNVVPSGESGGEGEAQAIYGSLVKGDVIRELSEKHGIVIDKDALSMNDKIKSVGEYTCVVKLIYAGQASFKACVVPTKTENNNNNNGNHSGDGTKSGKTGRWSTGPPQLNRSSRSPQNNSSGNGSVSPNGTGGNSQPTPRGHQTSAGGAAVASRSFSAVAAGNNVGGGSARGPNTNTNSLSNRSRLHELSSPASSSLGQGLIEGEAADQVEVMNQRLLFITSFLVGGQVNVSTRDGKVFSGILDSINPNDAQSVVLRFAYDQNAGKASQPIDTLVINSDDCLSVSGTTQFTDGRTKGSSSVGFKTDTDISRTGGQVAQRELHRWVPDESVEVVSLEGGLDAVSGSGNSWDQFATNEKLFGLTTDFDEEIYTTKLDRTRADYKEREREASRIAQEIQNAPYLNSHVAEERQDLAANDDGTMDEEDKYGAVLRQSGAPGKYVPPYLRSKADASQKPSLPAQQNGESGGKPPATAAQTPNNAVAAAALAKLNIRMTGHSPSPQDTGEPSGLSATPATVPSDNGVAPTTSVAGDPAITALSKTGSLASNSKLASLRGIKHRTDAAALNKPMADITEKLNSERERIQQHKLALRQTRISELKEFQKTFKLPTPMPEDLAEIIGHKKPSIQRSDSSGSTGSAVADTAAGGNNDKAPVVAADLKAAAAVQKKTEHPSEDKPKPKPKAKPSKQAETPPAQTTARPETPSKGGLQAKPEAPSKAPEPAKQETAPAKQAQAEPEKGAAEKPAAQTKTSGNEAKKDTEKKTSGFKFNAKASSFKPSAAATPFVPKPGGRPSPAATSDFNPFFGRRVLKKAAVRLWGDVFQFASTSNSSGSPSSDGSSSSSSSSSTADHAPTWPFGSRTYRSQFVNDEADAMMYQQQAYMHQYGYGYYQAYQYPPHMAMMPPGVAPRMPVSAAYSPGYGAGPYASTPTYASPVMVGDGRSPVMGAMGGPPQQPPPPLPPTAHPLPHVQGGSTVVANAAVATTPEIGAAMLPHAHIARSNSGADSPGVMYGQPPGPPVHMGMVMPPMAFGAMQPGAYMGPPPPQGYAAQQMPMPMGYAQYPPGIAMMHQPTPDQGTPGSHHSPF